MASRAQELEKHRRWKSNRAPRLQGFLDSLLENEFRSEAEQRQWQTTATCDLLRFAATEVPYYRRLFAEHGLLADKLRGPEDLPKLPVLTKAIVAARAADLRAQRLPDGERVASTTASSGTTGQPVKVVHSASSLFLFSTLWHRQARWFDLRPQWTMLDVRIGGEVARDPSGQPNRDGIVVERPRWRYLGQFCETGREFGFNVSNSMEQQVAWIKRIRPDFVTTYPGTYEEWLLANEGISPTDSLKRIICLGAQLTPSLRERLEAAYRIPIHQTYGLNEIGKVALRCQAGRYHVHTEACLVEIVDSAGQPCAPGETGHLLVTALRNAAMPLIRYDTGDLAEAVAGPCPCGRTLPSFGEVAGRFRRFAGLPAGTRERVNGLLAAFAKLPAEQVRFLRRYQIYQDGQNRFTLRLQVASPVPESFRQQMERSWLAITGSHQDRLTLAVVDQIASSPSGKLLDFTSGFYGDNYAAEKTSVLDSNFERQRAHWNGMAQRFAHIGPPLRPSAPDLEVFQQAIHRQAERFRGQPWRALLLGVTREIALLDWPDNCQLVAIDRSAEMVRSCWIGDVPTHRQALCGDWLQMIPQLGELGLVIGDGSLSSLEFPHETRKMLRLLQGSLLPGGLTAIRCFFEPEFRESPQDVIEAIRRREIQNFHVAKFRFAMSLQPAAGAGVNLAQVWRAWNDFHLDPHELQTVNGWSADTIRTIDSYKDSPGFQSFPTLDQFRSVAAEYFEVQAPFTPSYEMGDRCPTLVLVKAAG